MHRWAREGDAMTDAAAEPRGASSPALMHPAVAPLFVASIFAGSFLLFLVQPMVARMALPRLGGAPSVWNSAMLVYQALLLAGYGYAHLLGRVSPRAQSGVHLVVLLAAALWLPIGLIATDLPPDAQPALWVPWLLGLSIGPLFLRCRRKRPCCNAGMKVQAAGAIPMRSMPLPIWAVLAG